MFKWGLGVNGACGADWFLPNHAALHYTASYAYLQPIMIWLTALSVGRVVFASGISA
jgi:hypothetical protein